MKYSIRKKIAAVCTAAAIGMSASAAVLPIPKASAGWGWIGAVAGTAIQMAAVDKQFQRFDNEERHEFGNQLRARSGVNEDPELNARLDELMSNLTAAVGAVDPTIYDKPYNYFINKDETFNAFCSLGHNISVNTGLFNLLDSDDEIAFVLAHEMGHGQKNHVIKGFRKSIPVNILGAAISAESGIGVGVLTEIAVNHASATQITKPQEWEADNLAFDYIIHSPYNLGAGAALWQRVIQVQGSRGRNDFVGEIFSPNDHPTNEKRRDNYAQKMNEYSNGRVSVIDGTVSVNGGPLLAPVDTEAASGAERSYLLAGGLARVYHEYPSAAPEDFVADEDALYYRGQVVFNFAPGEDGFATAERLNQLNKLPPPANGQQDKQTKKAKKAKKEKKAKRVEATEAADNG